jgi:prevent-host-death family protein
MEKTMRTVTASDANRNFSGLLRDVACGENIIIVSRGTPVAKISPVDVKTGRNAAKESLLLRLSGQDASGRRDWTRNELYSE